VNRFSQRLVAVACTASLLSGCAVTRKQRTYAIIGGTVVTVGAAGYAISRMLAHCPDHAINGDSEACEADRIDERNTWAGVALLGLLATIGLQLLPVSDPEQPAPTSVAVLPPPPPPDSANALHSPVAVELAYNARVAASAGRCVEAFGSLKALAAVDRGLADQLRAWDPAVSRCRTAAQAQGSETAVEAPTPVPPAPAGPGGQPATP
jgi:hypothetical protein